MSFRTIFIKRPAYTNTNLKKKRKKLCICWIHSKKFHFLSRARLEIRKPTTSPPPKIYYTSERNVHYNKSQKQCVKIDIDTSDCQFQGTLTAWIINIGSMDYAVATHQVLNSFKMAVIGNDLKLFVVSIRKMLDPFLWVSFCNWMNSYRNHVKTVNTG